MATSDDDEDDATADQMGFETRKLWMTNLLAVPSEWRNRAANLAGLLSAAAAASVAAILISSDETRSPLGDGLAIMASLTYLFAIMALISATVFPNPRVVGKGNHSFDSRSWCYFKVVRHPYAPLTEISQWTDWAENFSLEASKPLRTLTLMGSAGGGLAVLLGFCAALSPILFPGEFPTSQMRVALLRPQLESVVSNVCPGVGSSFAASVTRTASDLIIVEIDTSSCGGGRSPTFEFQQGDVLLIGLEG